MGRCGLVVLMWCCVGQRGLLSCDESRQLVMSYQGV